MTRVQFGFIMPAGAVNASRRPTFVEDLNRDLELVTGHFDSAWSIDGIEVPKYLFMSHILN